MPANGIPFSFMLRGSILREIDRNLLKQASIEARDTLRSVRTALESDQLDLALRQIDRAWRTQPVESALFAPLYGRLLALEGRDHNAALHLLESAAEFSPDPDVAALVVVSLLQQRRHDEALLRFEAALSNYCIDPDGLLAGAGTQLLGVRDLDLTGWIGLGSELQIQGELSPTRRSNHLDVSIGAGPALAHMLTASGVETAQRFTLRLPSRRLDALIEVRCHHGALIGDGRLGPQRFLLDGRAEERGRRVRGWARIGWRPDHPVPLRIEDGAGHCVPISLPKRSEPSWRWPFSLQPAAVGLRGSRFVVSAQLPDGTWQPLPDTPLLLEAALRLRGRHPQPLRRWSPGLGHQKRRSVSPAHAPLIDVIVPVYGGREETLHCIHSVLASLDDNARLVVVDDASEDSMLAAALDSLRDAGQIRLLRNARNRGFVDSANRGLSLCPTRDVVLLNSDTLVFDGWLTRLRSAAYSDPRIGSVTPFTNSGSIASYPMPGGAPIEPRGAAFIHSMAASLLPGVTVEIPVGVGFCLYLRRDCLRDVGLLDSAAFGKGYGEEVDFCLRARRRGWSHVLAADVFVYHSGGVSFAGRRNALLERSQRLLDLRHPGYHDFIADFIAQNPLQPIRRRLDQSRLLDAGGQIVLIVTLALPGGVDRYVSQRCAELLAQGLFPLLLRPASAGDSARCELWTDAMELPNLQYDIPGELTDLRGILANLHLKSIEIQHFLHLDSQVIDAVRELGVPYDVVVHDYSWVCPRVTLIDGSGMYCGEPPVAVCQKCVRRHGSLLGQDLSVPDLRARSASWLAGARAVSAPSTDTASRLLRYFPDLTVDVRPHGHVAPAPAPVRQTPRRTLRVALIGAIGTHKGYRVLLGCARDARARRLPIEFVVVGHTELDAPLLATGKVFVTGRYSESEALHLIRREDPDMAMLPSVWPETWCYALDLALSAGLAVVAFDLGAIAERLRAANHGELLPLGLAPRSINDRLLELGDDIKNSDLTKSIFFPPLVS